MAVFPSTLPLPRADNYAINPVDPVVRTDMEVGATRARRRTAARNDKITLYWVFSDAQFKTFRDWFDDGATGAAGGSAWFTVDLAVGDVGIDNVEARFAKVFKAEMVQVMRWKVSAEVEVR